MSSGCVGDGATVTTSVDDYVAANVDLCPAGWRRGEPAEHPNVSEGAGGDWSDFTIGACAELAQAYADVGLISAWAPYGGLRQLVVSERTEYCLVFSGSFDPAAAPVAAASYDELFCMAAPSTGVVAPTTIDDLVHADAKALCPAGWQQGKPDPDAPGTTVTVIDTAGGGVQGYTTPAICAAAAAAACSGGTSTGTGPPGKGRKRRRRGSCAVTWAMKLHALIVPASLMEQGDIRATCYLYENFGEGDQTAAGVVGHPDENTLLPLTAEDLGDAYLYCPAAAITATTPSCFAACELRGQQRGKRAGVGKRAIHQTP